MIYQTFSRYYQLSLDGKVDPILCGGDKEHGIIVPNIDEFDTIYLYCLECNYKLVPGLKLYGELENILMNMPRMPLQGE